MALLQTTRLDLAFQLVRMEHTQKTVRADVLQHVLTNPYPIEILLRGGVLLSALPHTFQIRSIFYAFKAVPCSHLLSHVTILMNV